MNAEERIKLMNVVTELSRAESGLADAWSELLMFDDAQLSDLRIDISGVSERVTQIRTRLYELAVSKSVATPEPVLTKPQTAPCLGDLPLYTPLTAEQCATLCDHMWVKLASREAILVAQAEGARVRIGDGGPACYYVIVDGVITPATRKAMRASREEDPHHGFCAPSPASDHSNQGHGSEGDEVYTLCT